MSRFRAGAATAGARGRHLGNGHTEHGEDEGCNCKHDAALRWNVDIPPMSAAAPKLIRLLGGRDAALIVMGGIIGSGIFMNPSVVARFVGSGFW